MQKGLWTVALVALLAGYVYVRYPALLEGRAQDLEEVLESGLPKRIQIALPLVRPEPMRAVYLNREGAVLRSGADDSRVNQSSIVANMGIASAVIPAFAGSPKRFDAISKCITKKFAAYDVDVVTRRPVGRDYIMAMMGGTISVLGPDAKKKHHHAYGLSPYNGQPIADAVVLVFTRTMRERTTTVCETAAMEIAHAYGLDHARNCRDLMTYMKRCGARKFVDKDLACGEHRNRACGNGDSKQNSHMTLLELLGASALKP